MTNQYTYTTFKLFASVHCVVKRNLFPFHLMEGQTVPWAIRPSMMKTYSSFVIASRCILHPFLHLREVLALQRHPSKSEKFSFVHRTSRRLDKQQLTARPRAALPSACAAATLLPCRPTNLASVEGMEEDVMTPRRRGVGCEPRILSTQRSTFSTLWFQVDH